MQAQSTPRFEKLCEGMRNVEKLRIIRESYPDFADSVDSLIASLGTKNMVSEASRMRAQILNLSHAIQAFSQKQYTDVDYEAWYMDAARCGGQRTRVWNIEHDARTRYSHDPRHVRNHYGTSAWCKCGQQRKNEL